ncbi:hypothetical protein D9Q98_001143 [Chlorella vulgaris]|uniref:Uncharacterized protein n=1 Tax=Chlorella vulgaris TaxID=3077 RepID=A0A9D4TZR2_CHLVU|nr:hypothetical protein D9Q98_001143 [Chlorella vulgaris]
MGIPKFYRWLSERYPLINQPGGATVVPIIDNLYLDMNGIIHNCTHGNNPDVRLTEDEMVVRIFGYLDKLFHIVKPQKLLFMAIDGCAPRAKMNQQRSRRFKSAREAQEAIDAAAARGDPMPDADSRFDSNCITPGTPFMARLGAHIRFFIRRKMQEDPAWQQPTIIFSGHDVPGEGEHKIMEYIRWQKRRPEYAPNTRHCLYGLDADLIMLSLVTHEPHFCLLREVVSFTGGNRGQPAREVLDNPCQEHFVLLQIGLLRDYFDAEFKTALAGRIPPAPDKAGTAMTTAAANGAAGAVSAGAGAGPASAPAGAAFHYDLERVVDDFVLFCMLVGNDFLPPLPTVDINEGSLDSMFELYKELLPEMGGYLTHAGELHRGRLQLFMARLAAAEADVLHARAEDTEAFESKRGGRGGGGGGAPAWASGRVEAKRSVEEQQRVRGELDEDDAFALDMARLALQAEGHELELLAVVEGEVEEGAEGVQAISAAPTMMSAEARALFLQGDKSSGLAAWKSRYYREKLQAGGEAERRAVVESYIQGLHWVLEYYYRGVASWNWYYPFHYAPMASDLVQLGSIGVEFSLGKPFLPYEQLLAVQPASSFRLLPAPYQPLMQDPSSPIRDFYPTDFRIDMEGKRADWEGVVLIPFLDEQRLLAAAGSVAPDRLSAEERQRNTLGDILIFTHAPGAASETDFCATTMPSQYASVTAASSRATLQAAPPPLPAGERGFEPRFVPGTRTGGGGPPGFPSLYTIKTSAELRRIGVNVFGMPSRKESIILQLKPLHQQLGGQRLGAQQVAGALLGQRCWVKWPYLQEAVVEAVSDAGCKVCRGAGGGPPLAQQHDAAAATEWQQERHRLQQEYLNKQGVDCTEVTLVVHVRPCEGLVRQVDGTIEKRFAKKEVLYPVELVVRRNPAPDPRFQPETAAASLAAYDLKPGARALFLGRSHYGCLATVLPDASTGLTRKGKQLVAGGGGGTGPFRISLQPGPSNMATIAQSARRVLGNVNVQYAPSGQVSRRLGVSHRVLGRLTGNVWVQAGEERRDRVDVGLLVKNGAKALYVPDYARPFMEGGDVKGWAYSEALVRVLDDYRRRFPWLWAALETDGVDLTLDLLLPNQPKEQQLEQLAALQKWLKGLPLARRPLVKLNAVIAPEAAVKMLQAALPPRAKEQPPIELENVAATLLLPPTEKGGVAAALAGGVFDIGDRVACIGGSGSPAFGTRGTVVGVIDEAVEVVFDCEVAGGSDLYGRCSGNCGMLLPASDMLNLSKPAAVKAEGESAPRVVRSTPSAASTADGASAAEPAAAPRTAQQRPSPAAALHAATAALSGMAPAAAVAPRPYAATAQATARRGADVNGFSNGNAVLVPAKQQPKLPDQLTKGFGMGRGRGKGLPTGLVGPPASAPGAPPAPPPAAEDTAAAAGSTAGAGATPAATAAAAAAAAASNAAGALLSQLRRTPPSSPALPLVQPAAAVSPPGAALLQHLQRGGGSGMKAGVPPPPHLSQHFGGAPPPHLPPPHLPPPPHFMAGGLPPPPLPHHQHMMAPPLSPSRAAPPLATAGSGQALLAQLKSPSKVGMVAPPPSPAVPLPPGAAAQPGAPALPSGSALLQRLKKQQPGQAAPESAPAPAPAPAPGAQLLSMMQQQAVVAAAPPPQPAPAPAGAEGGAALLHRLQSGPAAAVPEAQSPSAGDLSMLWQTLQQQHGPPPTGHPPPPPLPTALLPQQPAVTAPLAAATLPPVSDPAPELRAAPAVPAVPAPSDLWQLLNNAKKA